MIPLSTGRFRVFGTPNLRSINVLTKLRFKKVREWQAKDGGFAGRKVTRFIREQGR